MQQNKNHKNIFKSIFFLRTGEDVDDGDNDDDNNKQQQR